MISIDNQQRLGYCRPCVEKGIKLDVSGVSAFVTIGLKPTQRWHILGRDSKYWILKRHNVVIKMDMEDFLKYFYRTGIK